MKSYVTGFGALIFETGARRISTPPKQYPEKTRLQPLAVPEMFPPHRAANHRAETCPAYSRFEGRFFPPFARKHAPRPALILRVWVPCNLGRVCPERVFRETLIKCSLSTASIDKVEPV
jgi:hypothetical protein